MKKVLLAAAFVAAGTTLVHAADPIMPPPVVVAPDLFDWSGFYLGAAIGGQSVVVTTPAPNLIQPGGAGFTAGAFLGMNVQLDSVVLGLEGDVEYSSFSATETCFNPAYTCTTNLNAQGSVRGRVGFAADRALLYVTGGLALANFGGQTDDGTVVADSSLRLGWTVGAGVDFAVTDNMFLRAQYRFSDYGTRTMTYDQVYPDIGVSTHQVTIGIGGLFN